MVDLVTRLFAALESGGSGEVTHWAADGGLHDG